MNWLRHSIVVLAMASGLALVAGGCDYDDHDHHHHHGRYYDERPVGYRYDPYYHDGWRGDRDWDRHSDRDWHHDRW
jgi:hypothetical protein